MENVDIIQLLSKDILALLLKEKTAMERYGHVVDSSAFESPIHKLMFTICREHFDTYGDVPTRNEFEAELQGRLAMGQGRHVPEEFFWEEAESILSRQPSREYLEDKLDDWVVRRSLIELSDKAKLLAFGERPSTTAIDELQKEIRKANEWKAGTKDMGEFVLRDMDRRNRQPEVWDTVPTGFQELDRLLGGGLGKGTLGIILAATGMGKSMTLITFGVNAVRARYKTLHVTLELSSANVINRYEAALTKIPTLTISEEETAVKERLRRIRIVATPADILVKEFPSGSLEVAALRAMLSNTRFWADFKPDLLIIDYADIMKLPGGSDEKWIRQGELYIQLRGLAQELNVALWTAVQSKKDALSKPKLRMEDMAGAVEKAQNADCIVAMCLAGKTRVRMADGRSLPIEKIVKDKICDEVLSFNSDSGRLEGKKITNWFRSPLGNRCLFRLVSGYRRNGHGECGPVITAEHKVMTASGWVEAKDIKGHLVNTGTFGFNRVREEVFFGTMLGDATLINAFSFTHAEGDEDYLKLKSELLNMDRLDRGRRVGKNSRQIAVRASKRYTPYLTAWRRKFYPCGKKVVPRRLRITPVSLAFWFMDDGSMHKKKEWAELTVASRTRSEVAWLRRELRSLGLRSSRSGPPWRIRFDKENSRKLSALVAPYVPKSMDRKLRKADRGDCGRGLPVLLGSVGDEVFYSPMRAVPVFLKDGRYSGDRKSVYCIEVEGNKNFVSSAAVVSNCRTEDERAKHEGRFYVAKNRNNVDDVTIQFRELFSQSRLEPLETPQPFDADPGEDDVPF